MAELAVARAPVDSVVLDVEGLTVSYATPRGRTVAVDSVDLALRRGEVLGIVGESGSGKTTTATAILGLVRPPGRIESGRIALEGVDLRQLRPEGLRRMRWQSIAFIPQGAMSALNPVVRIDRQFADAMRAHGIRDRDEIRRRIGELLDGVGLPARVARLFAHELSGGMKQRVCIAMAIALDPAVIVADEPTSALDVVVQRSVIETLKAVQRRRNTSLILIGHDVALQAQVVDRIGVMCRGRLVEIGAVAEVFRNPTHPYTRLLLASVPSIRQASWTPAAASQELRAESDALVDRRQPLRSVGDDHEAAVA